MSPVSARHGGTGEDREGENTVGWPVWGFDQSGGCMRTWSSGEAPAWGDSALRRQRKRKHQRQAFRQETAEVWPHSFNRSWSLRQWNFRSCWFSPPTADPTLIPWPQRNKNPGLLWELAHATTRIPYALIHLYLPLFNSLLPNARPQGEHEDINEWPLP